MGSETDGRRLVYMHFRPGGVTYKLLAALVPAK